MTTRDPNCPKANLDPRCPKLPEGLDAKAYYAGMRDTLNRVITKREQEADVLRKQIDKLQQQLGFVADDLLCAMRVRDYLPVEDQPS